MVVNRETGEKPHSFSLPYEARLHQRQDFLRFFEGSFVIRSSRYFIFRIPNAHGRFRLGITFKVRCTSVERNALRRSVRESFRKKGESLGSFDYNVVLRKLDRPAGRYTRELAKEMSDRLTEDAFVEAHSSTQNRRRDGGPSS